MDPLLLVRQAKVTAGLGDSDLRALADMGRMREFAPGETLFRQHDASDACYLIGSGEIEIGVEVANDWVPYYTLGPGHCAGIVSFFGRTQHRTTARAVRPTVTLAFGRDALDHLRQMPTLLLSIFERRTQRMRDLVEREEDLEGLSRRELEQRAKALRELLEDLEDQSTALHNEIHLVQIRLSLYESRLAGRAGEDG